MSTSVLCGQESVVETRLRQLASDCGPSSVQLDLLAGIDASRLGTDRLHDHLDLLGRCQSLVSGLIHQATTALTAREPFCAPEVLASALDETTAQAQRLCETSTRLANVHPQTVAGLLAGTVGSRHATTLATACRALPAGVALAVDEAVWPRVGATADPTQVKRAALSLAQRIDPESAQRRARAARDDRHVELSPGPDGTTWLGAQLGTEDAIACRDALREGIRALPSDDPRTSAQRAADLLVERITGRPPLLAGGRRIDPEPGPAAPGRGRRDRRVEIGVLVPLDTLLGLRTGGASIDGNPVPGTLARALAGTEGAVLRRLVTDPLTGALLDRAPNTYRPGAALKAFVKTRDQECWWPGCHVRARQCDEDHLVRFPDGSTIRINLGELCEHHHQLKHSGQWLVVPHPDGSLTLTGPDGHPRLVRPPTLDDGLDYEPPAVPPGPDPPPIWSPEDDPPF